MKKSIALVIIVAAAAGGWYAYRHFSGHIAIFKHSSSGPQASNITIPMTIASPVFGQGQPIPTKYTCDGDGVNPPLQIGNVPAQAQSLALIVDDPDAPGGTWTHWLLWNIPPTVTSIGENSVPPGAVQGQASSGQNAFGAPCPPNGIHHYYFYLYALPEKLSISSFSDAAALRKAIGGMAIAEAELMGTYGRSGR